MNANTHIHRSVSESICVGASVPSVGTVPMGPTSLLYEKLGVIFQSEMHCCTGHWKWHLQFVSHLPSGPWFLMSVMVKNFRGHGFVPIHLFLILYQSYSNLEFCAMKKSIEWLHNFINIPPIQKWCPEKFLTIILIKNQGPEGSWDTNCKCHFEYSWSIWSRETNALVFSTPWPPKIRFWWARHRQDRVNEIFASPMFLWTRRTLFGKRLCCSDRLRRPQENSSWFRKKSNKIYKNPIYTRKFRRPRSG